MNGNSTNKVCICDADMTKPDFFKSYSLNGEILFFLWVYPYEKFEILKLISPRFVLSLSKYHASNIFLHSFRAMPSNMMCITSWGVCSIGLNWYLSNAECFFTPSKLDPAFASSPNLFKSSNVLLLQSFSANTFAKKINKMENNWVVLTNLTKGVNKWE